MVTVRVQKMSDIMGCTPQTIRKWCRDGKIPYHTSPAGQLIFTETDIKQALGEQNNATTPLKPQVWAYYLRSSQGLTNLLNNQKTKLETIYPAPKYIIKDRASGLNENRSGLNRLLKLAENGDITDVAITAQDRLTRFGYKYIERYLNHLGVTIHYISKGREQNEYDELMSDFIALVASFAGRYYSQRNKQNSKRLLELAKEQFSDEQGDDLTND